MTFCANVFGLDPLLPLLCLFRLLCSLMRNDTRNQQNRPGWKLRSALLGCLTFCYRTALRTFGIRCKAEQECYVRFGLTHQKAINMNTSCIHLQIQSNSCLRQQVNPAWILSCSAFFSCSFRWRIRTSADLTSCLISTRACTNATGLRWRHPSESWDLATGPLGPTGPPDPANCRSSRATSSAFDISPPPNSCNTGQLGTRRLEMHQAWHVCTQSATHCVLVDVGTRPKRPFHSCTAHACKCRQAGNVTPSIPHHRLPTQSNCYILRCRCTAQPASRSSAISAAWSKRAALSTGPT